MTLRTVTYDDSKFKIVPIEPTEEMKRALFINLVHADDESRVIKKSNRSSTRVSRTYKG